ncbi:hypothetical protein PMI08_04359 [Brevibacillus sp. CF112]|nr:hypothetical protein PMI08_04359 [Brevibacillus sp. CF112]
MPAERGRLACLALALLGLQDLDLISNRGDIMSQPHAEAQPKKPKKLREINVFALLFAVIAVAVVLTYV